MGIFHEGFRQQFIAAFNQLFSSRLSSPIVLRLIGPCGVLMLYGLAQSSARRTALSEDSLYRRIALAKLRARAKAAAEGATAGQIHMAGVLAAEQVLLQDLRDKEAALGLPRGTLVSDSTAESSAAKSEDGKSGD
jgi:hypothetical protein